ncbi:hypothetical protein [Micromonospora violae]|uniref:hypothetical protein n=1 Tax=Micromonospora violae TaxID=1278207 RepID=UPI0033F7B1CA
MSARTGDLDIVAIGTTMTVADDDLVRLAAGHRTVTDLDTVAAGLAEGDVLVLARQHGRLRSQSPPMLTKSLCWAVVDGVHVIADEANNDHIWAGRAASELDTEHRVVPYAALVPHLLDERTCTVETCPEGPSMANTAVGSVPLVLQSPGRCSPSHRFCCSMRSHRTWTATTRRSCRTSSTPRAAPSRSS